jgi:hypothetical protein
MARLRGREPRSARLVANVSYGHWKTTTFVTALRIGGVTAPCVIDGPTDGDIFRAFEQFLAPTLKRDDVVIMDNLAAHKVGGAAKRLKRGKPRYAICGLLTRPQSDRASDPQTQGTVAQGNKTNHPPTLGQDRRPTQRLLTVRMRKLFSSRRIPTLSGKCSCRTCAVVAQVPDVCAIEAGSALSMLPRPPTFRLSTLLCSDDVPTYRALVFVTHAV